MPALAWLVHFPDNDSTMLAPRRELPQTGDEVLAGWIVTDHRTPGAGKPAPKHVDVWVTAKGRRRTIRQRTDRR